MTTWDLLITLSTWDLLITLSTYVLALIAVIVLLCLEVVRADDRLLDDIDAADDDDPTVVMLREYRDEVRRP